MNIKCIGKIRLTSKIAQFHTSQHMKFTFQNGGFHSRMSECFAFRRSALRRDTNIFHINIIPCITMLLL